MAPGGAAIDPSCVAEVIVTLPGSPGRRGPGYQVAATTVGTVAGALWLVVEHRRVTRIEEQLVRRTPR